MTAAARIQAVPAPRPDELPAEAGLFAGRVLLDEQSAALAGRIDAAFLAEAGWDRRLADAAGGASAAGPDVLPRAGLPDHRAAATRVCLDCQRRLAAAGLDPEDVALLPPPQGNAGWRRRHVQGPRVPSPVGDVRSAAVP